MVANFICRLDWPGRSGYLVRHFSGCVRCFWVSSAFESEGGLSAVLEARVRPKAEGEPSPPV